MTRNVFQLPSQLKPVSLAPVIVLVSEWIICECQFNFEAYLKIDLTNLNIDAIVSRPVNRSVQAEANDENATTDGEANAIARARVAPSLSYFC